MLSRTVVAIPARDEAGRIGPCLLALNRQIQTPDCVVLMLNNCSDSTAGIAHAMLPDLRFKLEVVSRNLPAPQASAGHARRLAMQLAASLADEDGVLLTTDADSVTPPDWIARNCAGLARGADIVCGRAAIGPEDAALIPAHLHADDARECRLTGLLDDIAWMLDPEPHDPPSRHTEASGASLAVRAGAFRRVGGIPAIPAGEDRAFVRALWMMDARVRHDPAIVVTVSGRIAGRAAGGMADTIRRRMIQQDEWADEQAEPAADAYRRYAFRNRARRAWGGIQDRFLAAGLGISPGQLNRMLAHRLFGAAWAALEATSPLLQRRRVRFAALTDEIAAAEAILRTLRPPETLAAD